MTDDRARWAPLETGEPVPARSGVVPRSGSRRRLRLRRSRSPVLAALDGGGDVFQRRGRDVMVGGVVLITPMVVLNLWTTVLAFDRLDDAGPSLPGFNDDATTGIEEIAAMSAVVLASFTATLVGVFVATILVGDRFGRRVGMRDALAATGRRLATLAAAWAIGHCWLPFVAAFLVGARSGEFAGRVLLAVPVLAVLSATMLYVAPVIVAEQIGPIRAIRRSWRLSRMRFGSAFGFVIASSFIGGLLLVGMATLPALLEATGFVTFGDYTWLANGIAAQIGVFVVVPLVALATAQMYLEVRLDAEGMDLVLDADAAFGPTVEA